MKLSFVNTIKEWSFPINFRDKQVFWGLPIFIVDLSKDFQRLSKASNSCSEK